MPWAAVVVVILGAIAGASYVLGQAVEEAGALARHVVSVRENTRRYLAQIEAQAARYESCLSRGGTPESCNELAPVPGPPQEPTSITGDNKTLWVMGATVLGIALLATLGYWGYTKFQSGGRVLPTRGLRGPHKRRALRSTYNMEVE